MPICILISTLTDDGRKTVKKHPNRIEAVNMEIENMGAKVLAPAIPVMILLQR